MKTGKLALTYAAVLTIAQLGALSCRKVFRTNLLSKNDGAASDKDVTFFDLSKDVEFRTNSSGIRGTFSKCSSGERVLVSWSSSTPTESDSGFADCSTAANAFKIDMDSRSEGVHKLYIWKIVGGKLVSTPSTYDITYDTTGPLGKLELKTANSGSIELTHTVPTDSDYKTTTLYRFKGTSCDTTATSSGTEVTVTTQDASSTVTDSGLSAGTNYCYRAIWADDLGNTKYATLATTSALPSFDPYDDDHDVKSRTNSATMRLTFSSCSGSDYVLLTDSTSKPDASSSSWKICATGKYGVTASSAISSLTEGSKTLYLWSKKDSVVSDVSTSKAITVDLTAPTGSISVPSYGTSQSSITVSVTHPTATDYTYISVYHLTGSCPVTSSTGSLVYSTIGTGTKTFTDGGSYSADSTHCYRAYFEDDVGNTSSDSVSANQGQGKTASNPSSCSVTPSDSSGSSRVWYVGSTASYVFQCDQSINTLTDPLSTWPSYLSAAQDTPTSGKFTVSGTTTAALGSSTLKARVNSTSSLDTNFGITVINTTPTFSSTGSPVSITSGTASSFTLKATLDASWDGSSGSGVTLKGLTGDATTSTTTSNGTVASTETDIPLLIYSDSSCGTGSTPTYCPSSTSTYTSGSTLESNTNSIMWTYGTYDKGQYFLRTKSYLNVEGAKFYSSQTTIKATAAVSNDAGTQLAATSGSASIDYTSFQSSSAVNKYAPVIAMSDSLSSSSKEGFAVLYPTRGSVYDERWGLVTIDRSTSPEITKGKFDLSTDLITGGSSGNVNVQSYGVAATSDSKYIAIGGEANGSSGYDLKLTRIQAGSSTLDTAINVTSFGTSYSVNAVSISPVFTDSDGTGRHGIAFYAKNGNNTDTVYVSKINSSPATSSEAGYFDGGTWYNSGSGINAYVSAVPISTSTAAVSSSTITRIVEATESSSPYFYVGWIDSSARLRVSRLAASGSTPTPITSGTSEISTNMDVSTGEDQSGLSLPPNYSIAAGLDTSSNAILAVLFTEAGDSVCKVSFLKPDSYSAATTLTNIVSSGSGSTVSTAAKTCRHPQLFYNSAVNKFMFVYIEFDGSSQTGNTYYKEFQVTSAGGVSGLTSATTITTTSTVSQFMSATYSSTYQRIGIIRIDAGNSGQILFDMYKTPKY